MPDDSASDLTAGLTKPRTLLLVGVAIAVAAAIAALSLDDDEFPEDDPVEIDI